jgi:sn-glycerol 3-phosphate transport system ATP-binding protein
MNLLTLDAATRRALGTGENILQDAPEPAAKLGLRPEHIAIDPTGSIKATVETVEYFGADSIVVCKLGGNSGVAVRTAGHVRVQAGADITLGWDPARQHFFDASGFAIQPAQHP